jgi:hypothetical protein
MTTYVKVEGDSELLSRARVFMDGKRLSQQERDEIAAAVKKVKPRRLIPDEERRGVRREEVAALPGGGPLGTSILIRGSYAGQTLSLQADVQMRKLKRTVNLVGAGAADGFGVNYTDLGLISQGYPGPIQYTWLNTAQGGSISVGAVFSGQVRWRINALALYEVVDNSASPIQFVSLTPAVVVNLKTESRCNRIEVLGNPFYYVGDDINLPPRIPAGFSGFINGPGTLNSITYQDAVVGRINSGVTWGRGYAEADFSYSYPPPPSTILPIGLVTIFPNQYQINTPVSNIPGSGTPFQLSGSYTPTP